MKLYIIKPQKEVIPQEGYQTLAMEKFEDRPMSPKAFLTHDRKNLETKPGILAASFLIKTKSKR